MFSILIFNVVFIYLLLKCNFFVFKAGFSALLLFSLQWHMMLLSGISPDCLVCPVFFFNISLFVLFLSTWQTQIKTNLKNNTNKEISNKTGQTRHEYPWKNHNVALKTFEFIWVLSRRSLTPSKGFKRKQF